MDDLKKSHRFSRRSRRRRLLRWIPLFLCVLLVAYVVHDLFLPHQVSSDGPLSLAEAHNRSPIPLPDTARNIHFLRRRHWIERLELARFEAPPQDCIDHIDVVLEHWRESHWYDGTPADPPTRLTGPPPPVRIVSEWEWFDPHNVQEGVTAGGGGSGRPRIWVDTGRGVFYYILTD